MTYVEDLPPGATAGKTGAQDNYREVVVELQSNQAEVGINLGITAKDIADIEEDDRRIAELEMVMPAAEKLAEMLQETYADINHRRHSRILQLATLIDTRMRAQPEAKLDAIYQKTRTYRSAIAQKSVTTRRRNQAAAEANSTTTDDK
jgi:hypothetical protein